MGQPNIPNLPENLRFGINRWDLTLFYFIILFYFILLYFIIVDCFGCRIQDFFYSDCRAEHTELPSLQHSSASFISLFYGQQFLPGWEIKSIFASSQEMLFTCERGELIHSLQGGFLNNPTWILLQQGEKKKIPETEITE